jgi:hypothetical protein
MIALTIIGTCPPKHNIDLLTQIDHIYNSADHEYICYFGPNETAETIRQYAQLERVPFLHDLDKFYTSRQRLETAQTLIIINACAQQHKVRQTRQRYQIMSIAANADRPIETHMIYTHHQAETTRRQDQEPTTTTIINPKPPRRNTRRPRR